MAYEIGTSGADFRSRWNLRSKQLIAKIEKKIQAYGVALVQELVRNTPVLTGQARANWQASTGPRTGQFIGPAGLTSDPKNLAHGLPQTVPYAAYNDAAIAVARSYKTGQVLYIFSNLPYIETLNRGSSRQAPAGFVETAILRARATLRS